MKLKVFSSAGLAIACVLSLSVQATEPSLPVQFNKDTGSGFLKINQKVERVSLDRKITRVSSDANLRGSTRAIENIHQSSFSVTDNTRLQMGQRIDIDAASGKSSRSLLLRDGYYNERLNITVELPASADQLQGQEFDMREWNYYLVKNGVMRRISSSAYSAAVDKTFAVKNSAGQIETYHYGAGTEFDSSRAYAGQEKRSAAVLVESADVADKARVSDRSEIDEL
ncbi:hypothetical protein P886_1305 [Alteromonadaceae bacterium 2753L.S.0a.02]|nr:hypothetical protein P886_1305 [Alteromonadaceae bacterium 2753L.S.0a.02]